MGKPMDNSAGFLKTRTRETIVQQRCRSGMAVLRDQLSEYAGVSACIAAARVA